MLPEDVRRELEESIAQAEHPRELAVDVMYTFQKHAGWLTDEALAQAAALLGMTELELEELATFYDFIYRQPVGRFVLHVCDGVVCWMCHEGWDCLAPGQTVADYICAKLGVKLGETTPDGLFTVLPSACIGYCDRAPAMLANGVPYGPLTPESVDEILQKLCTDKCELALAR